MTVAIIAAAVVNNAPINVNMEMAKLHHRLKMTIGVIRAATALITHPVMKNADITLLATFTKWRIVTTFAGIAIVDPGRSSFKIMAMGLNQ